MLIICLKKKTVEINESYARKSRQNELTMCRKSHVKVNASFVYKKRKNELCVKIM